MQRSHRRLRPSRLIGLGLLVVLVVAMVANTKFLNPTELAAAGPVKFDPAATAADLFTKAQGDLPKQASPLGEVVPALQANLKSATEKYKAVSPADGAYVIPVTVTGTVTEATDASLRLQVDGVPSETAIIIPLTTAINGTVIRDAMGFKFADAPGQTDYQYVGDELKKLMQAAVQKAIEDPETLKGKKVTVVGAISVIGTSQPRPKPVNVQPVDVKVGS